MCLNRFSFIIIIIIIIIIIHSFILIHYSFLFIIHYLNGLNTLQSFAGSLLDDPTVIRNLAEGRCIVWGSYPYLFLGDEGFCEV